MKNLAHPVKPSSRDRNRFSLAPVSFLLSLESTALALGLLDSFLNLCQGTCTLEGFLENLLYYLGLTQVIILPIILATPFLFRVVVDERGIGEHNLGERLKQTAWSEITVVKPVRFLGLSTLLVYSTGTSGKRFPRCLPLFVVDPDALWDAIAQYAPLGNPVRQLGDLRLRR